MTALRPLPDCEGPKLEPFARDINELLELGLVEVLDVDVGIGPLDSHVWKIKMDGKMYALKLFTFEESTVFCWSRRSPHREEVYKWDEDVQNLARIQTTPFYNECRAYGRLKELGLEHLAVKVHGYVQLFAGEKLDDLARTWGPKAGVTFRISDTLCRHRYNPEKYRKPVMGIVKDWVDNPLAGVMPDSELVAASRIEIARIPRLLREVHQLHQSGIVVRNLHADHYVDGVLVDFSRAWTIPHVLGPEGGVWPSWAFASMAAGDLCTFQSSVIDEWDRRMYFLGIDSSKGPGRLRELSLRAYLAAPDEGAITRLRPLAHRSSVPRSVYPRRRHRRFHVLDLLRQRSPHQQHGPLFPLFQGDKTPERAFVHWPKHDPSRFDWRHVELQLESSNENGSGPSGASRVNKERSRKKLRREV